LLEKPLGVMPGRLFLLMREGDMPNDKPLKPDDFPVEVEGEKLVKRQPSRRIRTVRGRLPQRAGQMVGLM
jgi:hypothetical protein